MTKRLTEIDKISAGPKLDSLIGREVMKIKPSENRTIGYKRPKPQWYPWPYSSNLLAAWAVYEKLASTFLEVHIGNSLNGHPWVRIYYGNNFMKEFFQASGKTVSLAICRVALKSVMEPRYEKPRKEVTK